MNIKKYVKMTISHDYYTKEIRRTSIGIYSLFIDEELRKKTLIDSIFKTMGVYGSVDGHKLISVDEMKKEELLKKHLNKKRYKKKIPDYFLVYNLIDKPEKYALVLEVKPHSKEKQYQTKIAENQILEGMRYLKKRGTPFLDGNGKIQVDKSMKIPTERCAGGLIHIIRKKRKSMGIIKVAIDLYSLNEFNIFSRVTKRKVLEQYNGEEIKKYRESNEGKNLTFSEDIF